MNSSMPTGPWPIRESFYLSHFCRTVSVFAGKGNAQVSFEVRRFSLEQSPVIKNWILFPSTRPNSYGQGEDIYFEDHDPDVVKDIIFFLHQESFSESFSRAPHVWRIISDPCYFVKFYFLADLLEMGWACQYALRALHRRKSSSKVYWNILQMKEIESLVDKSDFRDWLLPYLAKNENLITNPLPQEGAAERIHALLHITTRLHRKIVAEEEKNSKIREVLDVDLEEARESN